MGIESLAAAIRHIASAPEERVRLRAGVMLAFRAEATTWKQSLALE